MRRAAAIIALTAMAGSLGAVTAKPAAAQKPRSGCFISTPKLSPDKVQVISNGWCLINGRRKRANMSYSYTQADSSSNVCRDPTTDGSVTVKGRGATFPIKIVGAFYINVTFTATSRVKLNGHYIRSKSKPLNLTTGGREVNCGQGDLTAVVPPSVCGYAFRNDNVCGRPMSGLNLPLPFWTGMPSLFKGMVSPPAFAEPSGFCRRLPDNRVSPDNWLGNPKQPTYWKCADGTMFYVAVYVHLFVGGHECTTATAHPYGLRLEELAFPENWGPGHGDVEYEMVLIDSSGSKFYDSGSNTRYANEYADNIFRLDGNVDGCAQLTS